MNGVRSSRLFLVYLPTASDRREASESDWLRFVRTTADRLGIPLIDLVAEFGRLSPAEEASLLIQSRDALHDANATGHLNVRGNDRVAR